MIRRANHQKESLCDTKDFKLAGPGFVCSRSSAKGKLNMSRLTHLCLGACGVLVLIAGVVWMPIGASAAPRGPQDGPPGQGYRYEENGDEQNGYQENGREQNGYQENGREQNGYQENGREENGYQENGREENGYQENGYAKHGDEAYDN